MTLLTLAIVSMTIGLSLVGTTVFAPEATDRVTGNLKVAVQERVQEIIAPGALSQITLGVEGGMRELDRCDGTFTEMTSYRLDGVLPLYAAHNNCGGDVILAWEIGQQVRIAGSDVVYEVIEERHTPKWSNVDVLEGMTGEFMVQTCFYGENKMRFLALAPADP
ncbi:hypothetical protein LG299_12675 [Microbacterium lacus]|uniref:hypothetical protein n=1 Tax=Microbacterium lacus TaxID=415217 RepID=UPI00384A69F1